MLRVPVLDCLHGLWNGVGVLPPLVRLANQSLGQDVIAWCRDRRSEVPRPSFRMLAEALESEYGVTIHEESLRRWCATQDDLMAAEPEGATG